MNIGAELRRLRKGQRLTLAEVGRETGLSVSFLSDLERGRVGASLETLENLATFYQVSLADILGDATGETTPMLRKYPAGFEGFLDRVPGEVDEELKDLLLRVETRSRDRAETPEDWLQLYYSLKSILRR